MGGMSRRPLLPATDAVALSVFVAIGLVQHDGGPGVGLFLRTAAPLLGAWFATAVVTHPYRRPGLRSLLTTWIVAVPVGILVRTALVGSPSGAAIAVFLGVALAFTLLFLLVGRGALRAAGERDALGPARVVR